MRIDCHNHPNWLGHDLNKTLANMAELGIAKTWLLSWEAPQDEYSPQNLQFMPNAGDKYGPIPFSSCLDFAQKAPDRFILGYAPDPRRPEAEELLKAAVATYGVRVYGELKLRMTYDNPDALRMFKLCGRLGLPVLVHLDYELGPGQGWPRPNWWYGGGIEALARALAACPETNFIGHAPGFWAHISADGQHLTQAYPKGPVGSGGRLAELLDLYPNLYCDISAGSGHNALARDPGYTREFLIKYQERVLYGRDMFLNIHQELLASLDLPAAVLARIYAGNALDLVP